MPGIDPKTSKRLDSLYRNCKQMPILCIMGLFVPIVLPFIVPLCFVYASQRKRLLYKIQEVEYPAAGSDVSESPSIGEKIAYLTSNGRNFYLPIFATVAAVAVVTALIMFP